MDERALPYLNIHFIRSHTGRVLIASMILQRWQSQACSWLRRSSSICIYIKMGYVARQQAALAGKPLYDTTLFSSLSPPGKALLWGRSRLETAGTTDTVTAHQPCAGPSVKSSLNKWLATSKSPSGEKYTTMHRRDKASAVEEGNFGEQYFQRGGRWKTLLSSPEQSLEKLPEMAQSRILQNIHFSWTFLDYFKNFTSWLIASEALLRNTENTEKSKREGKVMSLLTFCALSSCKVPWVLFSLSASCLHLLGETLNRGKAIRWL